MTTVNSACAYLRQATAKTPQPAVRHCLPALSPAGVGVSQLRTFKHRTAARHSSTSWTLHTVTTRTSPKYKNNIK